MNKYETDTLYSEMGWQSYRGILQTEARQEIEHHRKKE